MDGTSFAADRHAASRTERHQRDRKPRDDLVGMIVVRRDAVATVAVEIQTGVGKRGTGGFHYPPLRLADRGRRRWIVQAKRGDQSWNVDLAVVHHAALASPSDARAQLVEPGARAFEIDESREVFDPPRRVIEENPPAVS